jgi:hypothetical protein
LRADKDEEDRIEKEKHDPYVQRQKEKDEAAKNEK